MDDVGWNIYTGNYGNGLVEMLKPSETSIGRWRVGPRDQPWGRFARSFQKKTGRTDMGFTLDKKLWGGLPLNQKQPLVNLEVVYFDAEGGSFEVCVPVILVSPGSDSIRLYHNCIITVS